MKLSLFLREIRIEHTLFALPFAYVGALLGARGLPSWAALGWITLAVLGARTAAMADRTYQITAGRIAEADGAAARLAVGSAR